MLTRSGNTSETLSDDEWHLLEPSQDSDEGRDFYDELLGEDGFDDLDEE